MSTRFTFGRGLSFSFDSIRPAAAPSPPPPLPLPPYRREPILVTPEDSRGSDSDLSQSTGGSGGNANDDSRESWDFLRSEALQILVEHATFDRELRLRRSSPQRRDLHAASS